MICFVFIIKLSFWYAKLNDLQMVMFSFWACICYLNFWYLWVSILCLTCLLLEFFVLEDVSFVFDLCLFLEFFCTWGFGSRVWHCICYLSFLYLGMSVVCLLVHVIYIWRLFFEGFAKQHTRGGSNFLPLLPLQGLQT